MREVIRHQVPSLVRGLSRRGRSADGLVLQNLVDLVPGHLAIPHPGAHSLSLGAEQRQNLPRIIDHVLRAAPGDVRSAKVVRGLEIVLTRKEGGNLKVQVTQSHDLNPEVEVDRRAKTNVVANSLSRTGNASGNCTEIE